MKVKNMRPEAARENILDFHSSVSFIFLISRNVERQLFQNLLIPALCQSRSTDSGAEGLTAAVPFRYGTTPLDNTIQGDE